MQVSAINNLGTGLRSTSVTLQTLSRGAPEQPDIPVLSTQGADLYAAWTAPWDGDSPIQSYSVMFKGTNGSW